MADRAFPLNRRDRRRLRHHALLALGSGAGIALLTQLVGSTDPRFQLSMATAYVALVLLALTLLLGPARVLLGRPNPVSTDLRRDLGIWSALVGVGHMVLGLRVHFREQTWLYFFTSPSPADSGLRFDRFGVANYAGLLAAFLLLLLLALSNDLSLRTLGVGRWKALQRLSYALIVLVLFHAVLYQALERRIQAYVSILSLIAIGVFIGQLLGAWRRAGAPPRSRA